MHRSDQVRFFTWKLFFSAVCGLVVLSACSQPQPNAQEPPLSSPPLTPGNMPQLPPHGKQPQPPNDVSFVRSMLEGSDRPGASPMDLLQNPQVKKELDITQEQSAKLQQIRSKQKEESHQTFSNLDFGHLNADQREQKLSEMSEQLQKKAQATQKEVTSIFKPEQLQRFKEITLQLYGWGLLTSNQFINELQITPQQQQQLAALHKQMLRQASIDWPTPANNTPEAQQVAREAYRQKMDLITRQSNQQALVILTPEQQKTLETLKGKKFELDPARIPQAEPLPST